MQAARRALLAGFLAGIATASTVAARGAQAPKVWTPEELFRRNIGTREDQDTAFPPHKIVGNLVDPAGYQAELDIVEGVFRSVLAQQSGSPR